MNKSFIGAAVVALAVAGSAVAAPVTLTGDYIKTGVSDDGTLGSNGSTSPGLIHDPSGTGTFGVNDYITPGSPHQGFSINSNESGFLSNDNYNNGGGAFATTSAPALLLGSGYDNAATWTGANSYASITNNYYFNNGDERIRVVTTITALSDLTDLAFATSVDPDPDVNTHGSFSTNNQRGNMLFGADDFIGSEGPLSGLTLAIVNLNGNGLTHGTQINGSCCSNIDPFDVPNNPGGLSSVGDHGLNMAWLVGDLSTGSSVTITYAYAVGDAIGTVGGDPGVPEPANWAMMIAGFGLVGSSMRYRQNKARVTLA